jgi:hypothetical protein
VARTEIDRLYAVLAKPSSPTSMRSRSNGLCDTAEKTHVLDDEKVSGDFAI